MHQTIAFAQQNKKPFTVSDDIAVAHFGDPYTGAAKAVQFSPNGSYVGVDTERGLLDENRLEDSLRFYRSQDIEEFLTHSDDSYPPAPMWVIDRLTDGKGPIISQWRWLADSSGVVFLERTPRGNQSLKLADLRKKTVEALTSPTEAVQTFDVRDRQHYVYMVIDPAEEKKWEFERRGPAIVGTGRSLYELLFPDSFIARVVSVSANYRNVGLWAVVDGKRFEVKPKGALWGHLGDDVALSPDGMTLVTTLSVPDVPPSWETLYPPPFASSHWRIRAHQQGPGSDIPSVYEYVRINVLTGSIQSLADAPISNAAGWFAYGSPSWSSDGEKILLPGTFFVSEDHGPSRPCVGIVDLASSSHTCVEVLKARTETGVEDGYHVVYDAGFANGDKQRVLVTFMDHQDSSYRTTEYKHTEGAWQVTGQNKGVPEMGNNGLEVTIRETFNQPPLLIATENQTSRVIWDPNPQLNSVELVHANVYTWKDKDGRDWRGGLYKPSNYKLGQHYPLVIQTHGFTESEFRPSGLFPTAFAARALAAAGIAVLQVGGSCPLVTVDEGPCYVAGYAAAASQLVAEGLVDPEKIGIIGFSRTCFYVMETLTTGSLHLKAASITDGVTESYFQYLMRVGTEAESTPESDSMIGAKPFGEGLQQWLRRSPGFNLDKINAPLLVVGAGLNSLLFMWESYAGLRFLRKPVDLIMLNTEEHILTNPAVRMASQGGSVDWFRFWLKDEEDPDATKSEQYKRWREMRKEQQKNENRSTTRPTPSN